MKHLKDLLSIIADATGVKPQAFAIRDIEMLPAMSYTIYRASDNGSREQWRMQTRITAKSLAEALDIERKLTDALCSIGDGTIAGCSIEVNGGGTMLEQQSGLPQQLTYFDITTKS